MELVRSECSSTLGGSLTNALIHDLKPFFKDVDLNHIMLDKSKLDRAKLKSVLSVKNVQNINKFALTCLGVDEKIDKDTLTYSQF